jgi:hypothetical protein
MEEVMAETELHHRLRAHRAAMAAIVKVVSESVPGAFDRIIESLSSFEAGLRRNNFDDATISELREIREGMLSMRDPAPPRSKRPRGRPS